MSSHDVVVAVALSQVGVSEATGKNDGAPAILYVPDGQEGLPWCAHFVRAVFDMSGWPLPGNRYSLGSVSAMEILVDDHGWLMRPGVEPKPGDIIFFRSRVESDPAKGGRHVGIVVGYDAHTGAIKTVEGNTSNKVAVREYRHGDPRITGFGRRT